MQHILDHCRNSFYSEKEDVLRSGLSHYIHIPPPEWLTKADDLTILFENTKKLAEEGVIVWGRLLQANPLLFEKGDMHCPGEVFYCLDSEMEVDTEELNVIAEIIQSLKDAEPDDPQLKEISDYLTDGRIRKFGLQIPEEISPNYNCRISTVFFVRHHLPTGVLTDSLFPLLVLPKEPFVAMVLPYRYWPQELISDWLKREREYQASIQKKDEDEDEDEESENVKKKEVTLNLPIFMHKYIPKIIWGLVVIAILHDCLFGELKNVTWGIKGLVVLMGIAFGKKIGQYTVVMIDLLWGFTKFPRQCGIATGIMSLYIIWVYFINDLTFLGKIGLSIVSAFVATTIATIADTDDDEEVEVE